MSTFRKINREKLKLEYKEFSKNWKNERAYQAFILAKGEKLPEGQRELGKRPTFNMWLKWRNEMVKARNQIIAERKLKAKLDGISEKYDEFRARAESSATPGDGLIDAALLEPDLEWNEE